jgi:cell division GTPase FtsZ
MDMIKQRRLKMKIVAIGIGQCGCNLADEFYAINNYSKSLFGRRIEILTEAFAINTDETDLASLRNIPTDRRHRIAIGMARTFGHGVGKVNIEGAKLMKDVMPVVIDDVLGSNKFYECDAVVVIASGAGGTGSGAIGWLVRGLKERVDRPIYAIVVLPFAYEEKAEVSYAVINAATCLKTVNQYADAVFLLDNERFGRGGISLANNFKVINEQMVKNFFDLFCAGEEKTRKYIGSTVVDAGDIKQSLGGISTIGRGEVALSTFYRWRKEHYLEATRASVSLAGALSQAINNLCLNINMEDARKVMALVCAPKDVITMSALAEITNSLEGRSPQAVVRIGDYPRRGKETSVTVVLSTLTAVDRMESLFVRAEDLLKKRQKIEKESDLKIEQMLARGGDVPTLDE